MGSVLIERNDLLQGKKAIFSPKTYAKLKQSEVPGNLCKYRSNSHTCTDFQPQSSRV